MLSALLLYITCLGMPKVVQTVCVRFAFLHINVYSNKQRDVLSDMTFTMATAAK